MSLPLEQLIDEVLALPVEQRAALAEKLLASLQDVEGHTLANAVPGGKGDIASEEIVRLMPDEDVLNLGEKLLNDNFGT